MDKHAVQIAHRIGRDGLLFIAQRRIGRFPDRGPDRGLHGGNRRRRRAVVRFRPEASSSRFARGPSAWCKSERAVERAVDIFGDRVALRDVRAIFQSQTWATASRFHGSERLGTIFNAHRVDEYEFDPFRCTLLASAKRTRAGFGKPSTSWIFMCAVSSYCKLTMTT